MKRRDFLSESARLAMAAALSRRSRAPGASPVLDAHVHPASRALLAYREKTGGRGGVPLDGAELVRRLDADGIQRAFVLSTAYQMAADVNRASPVLAKEERERVARENDFAAEQCARYQDRLVPFLSVNPKREYAVDEIDRCVERLEMRGLKLHLWNSLIDTRKDADLAALRRVVGHAAARGLPVVAHIYVGAVADYGADDTERFVREVIAPLDALKISIAHLAGAGGFGARQEECFERLIALCGPGTALAGRVWTDMAAIFMPTTSAAERARFAALAPRWGLERLLWGSDSIDGALARAREAWPLDDAAWRVVATDRADAFCRSPTP